MTIAQAEVAVHLCAILVYATAAGTSIWGVGLGRPRWLSRAMWLGLLGFAVHGAALALRWVESGHGPYVTRFEVLSSNAACSVLVFLVLAGFRPALRPLSVVVYPAAFLLVALGLYSGVEIRQLPPTFAGAWLVLHVAFYFLAFGSGLAAVAASVLYLTSAGQTPRRFGDQATLDSAAYRLAGVAFAFWGVGMLTGSIWAYYSWGSYWTWDPIETWSLVTGLAFGVYLHLRRSFGWKGARAAYVLFACFALAVGSLFFTSLIETSLHSAYFR